MSSLFIPTFEDPFYTQLVNLDEVNYLFEFKYNQRENTWYLDISSHDGVLLVAGMKLLVNYPIMKGKSNPDLPPGHLIVTTDSADDSPPGLLELGENKRCRLFYLTGDDA